MNSFRIFYSGILFSFTKLISFFLRAQKYYTSTNHHLQISRDYFLKIFLFIPVPKSLNTPTLNDLSLSLFFPHFIHILVPKCIRQVYTVRRTSRFTPGNERNEKKNGCAYVEREGGGAGRRRVNRDGIRRDSPVGFTVGEDSRCRIGVIT